MSRQTAKFSAAIKRAKRLYKTGRYKTFGDAVKAAYKKGKTKTVGSHKKKKAIPTKIKTKGKTHYNWLNPKVTRQPVNKKGKSRGMGAVSNYLTFPVIYWRVVKDEKIPFVQKGGSFITLKGQKIHWQFNESRVAQSWLKKHKTKTKL